MLRGVARAPRQPVVRPRPAGSLTLVPRSPGLGEDIIVPDVAGWRRERLSPGELRGAFFTTAPDWVCEVLSPRTAVHDRTRKLPIYARHLVTHASIVHPRLRTLEVFRLEGAAYEEVDVWRDTDLVRAPPFEALEIELAELGEWRALSDSGLESLGGRVERASGPTWPPTSAPLP